MGIDVYLRWDGMSEKEVQKQYCGFSVVCGKAGYLREAYHGGPYATHTLVAEAFAEKDERNQEFGTPIPAKVMQERLESVVAAAIYRESKLYGRNIDRNHPVIKSFIDFVRLAKRKEKASGKPCRVITSY